MVLAPIVIPRYEQYLRRFPNAELGLVTQDGRQGVLIRTGFVGQSVRVHVIAEVQHRRLRIVEGIPGPDRIYHRIFALVQASGVPNEYESMHDGVGSGLLGPYRKYSTKNQQQNQASAEEEERTHKG